MLEQLLRRDDSARAIVFTRTKHGANRVVQHLQKAGLDAEAIHGNKSQNAREHALGRFRSGDLRVLVATDLASRGIDIDDISHVINYDIPIDPESYVHRIGRTARAGRSGSAITFCARDDRPTLTRIERLTGQAMTVLGAPASSPSRAGASTPSPRIERGPTAVQRRSEESRAVPQAQPPARTGVGSKGLATSRRSFGSRGQRPPRLGR